MTTAKSKPSAPSRQTPSANAKPAKARPATQGKGAPVATKTPAVKRSAAKAVSPAKVAPAKTVSVAKTATAAPLNPTTAKVAPPKPTAAKVAAKPAASKLVPEPAPAKPAPAKVAAKAAVPSPTAARFDTPAKLRPIEQAVGVSSDAVARRTGKSWPQWFALLDAAGAGDLDHKGIVAVLAQRHGVGPWWQQMVTVAYEHARGKDGKQATEEGFQVDLVKVLELPLAKLFRLWSEPAERNKWLCDDRFSIHKSTASKSIHARWGRGVSRIDVDFCEKGPSKSQVTVQHHKIESSDAAEQMKAYWAKKIRALEELMA